MSEESFKNYKSHFVNTYYGVVLLRDSKERLASYASWILNLFHSDSKFANKTHLKIGGIRWYS